MFFAVKIGGDLIDDLALRLTKRRPVRCEWLRPARGGEEENGGNREPS